jgi:hypothetical protein
MVVPATLLMAYVPIALSTDSDHIRHRSIVPEKRRPRIPESDLTNTHITHVTGSRHDHAPGVSSATRASSGR